MGRIKVEDAVSSGGNTTITYANGTTFPITGLVEGLPFYRTDLREVFHYSTTLSRWVGETRIDGYGANNNTNNNAFFRRFNGMPTGVDEGIIFPYEILITEHGANWNTPNNAGGSIEMRLNGVTLVHNLITIGDSAHDDALSIVIPPNSVLSFQRGGATLADTQGYFKYHRLF